eukprot:scaffold63972_cov36-Phaeocystis_antarctica.AAC.1
MVQLLVTAMGAIGVRFNARKSYYLWSAAAAKEAGRDPTEAPEGLLTVQGRATRIGRAGIDDAECCDSSRLSPAQAP